MATHMNSVPKKLTKIIQYLQVTLKTACFTPLKGGLEKSPNNIAATLEQATLN
jgi:hypothetical protein